jgi:GH25 family lysozyme M1 (1,4-beta-N-acetylmuramidase)
MRLRSDGPDISYWQWTPKTTTDPDFKQIPYFPYFVHRASRGFDVRDDGFDRAWPQMRTQGYPFRGAFHWMEPRRIVGESMPISPVMQADLFLDTVIPAFGKLEKGEFLYLDIEKSTADATHNYGGAEWPTIEDCETFVQRVVDAVGPRIGIYVGWYAQDPSGAFYSDWVKQKNYFWVLPWFVAPDGTDTKFDTTAPSGFHIRQWTSTATVAGMPTKVDMNHVADWKRLCEVAGY